MEVLLAIYAVLAVFMAVSRYRLLHRRSQIAAAYGFEAPTHARMLLGAILSGIFVPVWLVLYLVIMIAVAISAIHGAGARAA